MGENPLDGIGRYVSFFLIPVLGVMVRIPFADDRREQQRRHMDVTELMFNKSRFRNKNARHGSQWWTILTHMFVHQNRDHLISNALTMIPSAFAVSKNYGILATYTVFLGGGVFAALQSQDYQIQQAWSKTFAFPFANYEHAKGIGQWWDRNVRRASSWFEKYVIRYCGCSAGVAALEGMQIMIWLEQIAFALVFPNRDPPVPTNGLSLILTAVNVVSLLTCYANEMHYLSSGTRYGIDHAGHLAGFCFGLGCFGVVKAVTYVKRQLRSRKTWR